MPKPTPKNPAAAAAIRAAANSAAAKQVAKLVANYGAKVVSRALKAANTPVNTTKAAQARARGKGYQLDLKQKRNVKVLKKERPDSPFLKFVESKKKLK